MRLHCSSPLPPRLEPCLRGRRSGPAWLGSRHTLASSNWWRAWGDTRGRGQPRDCYQAEGGPGQSVSAWEEVRPWATESDRMMSRVEGKVKRAVGQDQKERGMIRSI